MKRARINKVCLIFFLINIMIFSAVPVSGAEVGEGRVVRVACGMNDALYLDDAGDPQGSCLYYVRQLAWNKNWTVEYVEGSYNESLQNLMDGKVDLMFPVSREDDPDGRLAYSDYIGGYQQIGLFAKEGSDIFYEDYVGFDKKKVGLSIGSNSEILDEYAQKHDFTYEKVALNSVQDKIDALMNGDVDMVAFSTMNSVPGGKQVAVLNQVPVYFCTRAEDTELMQEVNESMSEEMVNTPDVVSDMYQGVMKGNNAISYTREENEKIKSADPIVFGVYSDCLPLAGTNKEGESVGIYVDVLKEIASESGLNIEIKAIPDSNKLYSYMDDGTVDFVIGLQELRFSSENADNHLASNGIADYTTVAVSRPDYQFDEAEDPHIILTRARNFLEDYIYTNFPKAVITYCDTRKECLNAVQSGEADATFMNTWEYNYETKNPRFQELMEWESMRITSVFGLGGTRQSDLEILSILEKTISQLSAERISDIIAANLNMPYESYTLADRFYAAKSGILITALILLIVLGCLLIYMRTRRKYIKDLVVANNTKSDFLSRMSHELRTPLNAIDGYAALTVQSVQKGDMSKEIVLDHMDSIQKASDYLLGIITDILDVQRMETGRITLDTAEMNPKEYMGTIVKMVQPMADEKGVAFTYTMISGADYNYVLDRLRMQQILFNLLYNAVKFTDAGGSVNLSSELVEKDHENATLRFIVKDTGIGMSKEFMETRLFHKFAQENQDITSPYGGCGNGLVICKQLVELMDGTITCESEQGKGTTFTVIIKAKYVKPKSRYRARRPMPDYDLGGIRVLMCEDNKMNQDMEKHLLERMNCQVDIADDGQIGLDLFRASEQNHYGIVLMDIRMPNMDGLEAAKSIRALDREDAKIVPILAVSANAFAEDVQQSLDAGMNEHLAKPVDARILYAKLKEYCAGKA